MNCHEQKAQHSCMSRTQLQGTQHTQPHTVSGGLNMAYPHPGHGHQQRVPELLPGECAGEVDEGGFSFTLFQACIF